MPCSQVDINVTEDRVVSVFKAQDTGSRYSELLENTTFRKLDLFPSSGEGRHLLCWVP
jgi:hypothetical protein